MNLTKLFIISLILVLFNSKNSNEEKNKDNNKLLEERKKNNELKLIKQIKELEDGKDEFNTNFIKLAKLLKEKTRNIDKNLKNLIAKYDEKVKKWKENNNNQNIEKMIEEIGKKPTIESEISNMLKNEFNNMPYSACMEFLDIYYNYKKELKINKDFKINFWDQIKNHNNKDLKEKLIDSAHNFELNRKAKSIGSIILIIVAFLDIMSFSGLIIVYFNNRKSSKENLSIKIIS